MVLDRFVVACTFVVAVGANDGRIFRPFEFLFVSIIIEIEVAKVKAMPYVPC
jgi:hypothetical protein